ncbi:MAG TPA: 1-deoxy-D-xylulose-5-phosphate reductoisomerase, partial [Chloroflexota bacterium]
AVHRIILTSSGGALRDVPLCELEAVKPEQALQHPTWSMGPKITIDSATLMNKGLEIIEASWLFSVPASMVSVMLHRQSIVHAVVEFRDGSSKAQLSTPDMRFPLLHALVYPERPSADLPTLDLLAAGGLTFEPVDDERYPALHLAREVAEAGSSYPAALNAANEIAVERFLTGDLGFTQIVPVVKRTLDLHQPEKDRSLAAILAVDSWARAVAREMDC